MEGAGLVCPREILEIELSLAFVMKKRQENFHRRTPIFYELVWSTECITFQNICVFR